MTEVTWLNFVRENKNALQYAVDQYEDCWYNIRQLMAEQGVEMTPDELKDSVSLVKQSIEDITENK